MENSKKGKKFDWCMFCICMVFVHANVQHCITRVHFYSNKSYFIARTLYSLHKCSYTFQVTFHQTRILNVQSFDIRLARSTRLTHKNLPANSILAFDVELYGFWQLDQTKSSSVKCKLNFKVLGLVQMIR